PVAPPSPDYVPGPEHPLSPDYVPDPEHLSSPIEIPYVPKSEYLAPSDDEAPLEDQPLPTNASLTAASPDYPFDDDNDDDATDDKDPEEHPALADSSTVPIVDLVLPARDTEALEADEPTHAPGSPIIIPLSLTLGAARQLGPTESDLRRCRVDQAGYEITDTWDEIVDTLMEMASTTLEGVNERVTELDTTVRYTPDNCRTAMLIDREAMYAREAWTFSMDRKNGTQEKYHESNTRHHNHPTITVTNAQLQALIDQGVAVALAKRDADRSRNELALMCERMFPEEAAKEAIEFATETMDKRMLTHAERQAEQKWKVNDTLRNNQHQQQPFKRNNVARAYTASLGDKKPYGGTKPLSTITRGPKGQMKGVSLALNVDFKDTTRLENSSKEFRETVQNSLQQITQTLATLTTHENDERRNPGGPRLSKGRQNDQPQRQRIQLNGEDSDVEDDFEEEWEVRGGRFGHHRHVSNFDYRQRAKYIPSFHGSMNVEDFLD
nr:hypothetical protein CTI12_AA293570 [Tanacetum cinerariifolium]